MTLLGLSSLSGIQTGTYSDAAVSYGPTEMSAQSHPFNADMWLVA